MLALPGIGRRERMSSWVFSCLARILSDDFWFTRSPASLLEEKDVRIHRAILEELMTRDSYF